MSVQQRFDRLAWFRAQASACRQLSSAQTDQADRCMWAYIAESWDDLARLRDTPPCHCGRPSIGHAASSGGERHALCAEHLMAANRQQKA